MRISNPTKRRDSRSPLLFHCRQLLQPHYVLPNETPELSNIRHAFVNDGERQSDSTRPRSSRLEFGASKWNVKTKALTTHNSRTPRFVTVTLQPDSYMRRRPHLPEGPSCPCYNTKDEFDLNKQLRQPKIGTTISSNQFDLFVYISLLMALSCAQRHFILDSWIFSQ
jgi:hypothetical protein